MKNAGKISDAGCHFAEPFFLNNVFVLVIGFSNIDPNVHHFCLMHEVSFWGARMVCTFVYLRRCAFLRRVTAEFYSKEHLGPINFLQVQSP